MPFRPIGQSEPQDQGNFRPLDPNTNHLGFKTTPVLGEPPKKKGILSGLKKRVF